MTKTDSMVNLRDQKFLKKVMILFSLVLLIYGLFSITGCNTASISSAQNKDLSVIHNNNSAENNSSPTLKTEGTKLTVQATNVRNTKGKVFFFLYDNEKSWNESEDDGKPLRELSAEIKPGKTLKDNTAEVVFENLPKGDYAIQLHHDENNNGKMDTTMGIPSEGYGISNDPQIGMSMPKFGACKFAVAEEKQTVLIKMKY